MKFLDNFDINHVSDEGESKRDFGPVPAGHYRVICERAEETVTKSTSTEAAKFARRIADGEFAGRLWDQMNLDHPTLATQPESKIASARCARQPTLSRLRRWMISPSMRMRCGGQSASGER